MQIREGHELVVRTLGISWYFITTAKVSPGLQLRKRKVLRKVATVLDPLGFVVLLLSKLRSRFRNCGQGDMIGMNVLKNKIAKIIEE